MMIPGAIVRVKAPIVTLSNKVIIESLNREVILGEIEIERLSDKLRENSSFKKGMEKELEKFEFVEQILDDLFEDCETVLSKNS